MGLPAARRAALPAARRRSPTAPATRCTPCSWSPPSSARRWLLRRKVAVGRPCLRCPPSRSASPSTRCSAASAPGRTPRSPCSCSSAPGGPSAAERDGLAGVLLGLLLFKPQFALLAVAAVGRRPAVAHRGHVRRRSRPATWAVTAAFAGAGWVAALARRPRRLPTRTEDVNATNHVSLSEAADAVFERPGDRVGRRRGRRLRRRPRGGGTGARHRPRWRRRSLLCAAHAVFYDIGLALDHRRHRAARRAGGGRRPLARRLPRPPQGGPRLQPRRPRPPRLARRRLDGQNRRRFRRDDVENPAHRELSRGRRRWRPARTACPAQIHGIIAAQLRADLLDRVLPGPRRAAAWKRLRPPRLSAIHSSANLPRLDLVEDLLHLRLRRVGDDARPAGDVAVLGGVGDRVAHAGDALLVHEVDDELQLVQALEVGRLGLVAGLDERLEPGLHERR